MWKNWLIFLPWYFQPIDGYYLTFFSFYVWNFSPLRGWGAGPSQPDASFFSLHFYQVQMLCRLFNNLHSLHIMAPLLPLLHYLKFCLRRRCPQVANLKLCSPLQDLHCQWLMTWCGLWQIIENSQLLLDLQDSCEHCRLWQCWVSGTRECYAGPARGSKHYKHHFYGWKGDLSANKLTISLIRHSQWNISGPFTY